MILGYIHVVAIFPLSNAFKIDPNTMITDHNTYIYIYIHIHNMYIIYIYIYIAYIYIYYTHILSTPSAHPGRLGPRLQRHVRPGRGRAAAGAGRGAVEARGGGAGADVARRGARLRG